MREIKFRVWLINEKKMIIPLSVHNDNTIKTQKEDKNDIVVKWYNFPNECNIMQYTGLLDKTGKEIYESDIIKSIQGVGFVIMPVIWSIGRTGYFPFNGCTVIDTVCPNDSEIIGNIYENPELLK